jgi:uncharacterized protein (TIGR00255 family)
MGADHSALFKLTPERPEVALTRSPSASDENWNWLEKTLRKTIELCQESRKQEGEVIKTELLQYADDIRRRLASIEELLGNRSEKLETRLKTKLDEVSDSIGFDANRFEQELIYYLEKLDITEEIVRLKSHLAYLEATLQQMGELGKKVGFISQEIGREINTIGSKANDHLIQHLVVEMKEALEKIKEQSLNLL